MKIKTTQEAFFGFEMKVPVDGKVQLDSEGAFEASEAAAAALLTSDQWILCDDEESIAEDVNEEGFDEGVEDEKKVELFLNEMEIKDLIKVCETAGFPKKDWDKYKKSKKSLIAYINKQQQLEEE